VKFATGNAFVSGDGPQFSAVHSRGIIAPIGVHVCDERTRKM